MKRIFFLLFLFLFVTACAAGTDLPEGFDEETVRTASEEALDMLHNKDTEGLRERMTDEMRESLHDEAMEQVYVFLDDAGAFDTVEDIEMGSATHKESNQELAICALKAKHEEKSITYTLSFTEDMKIAGLFLR